MKSTGVMFSTDRMSGSEYTGFAQRIEALGLDTVWVPEIFGREPFAASAHLLASTSTVRVATGIASVYARDAVTTAAARRTLAELSDGRFALGLGVSNAGLAAARGHEWEAPVAKLRTYLADMEEAASSTLTSLAAEPEEPAPLNLAAHGPKMLEFAAEASDGVNTWLMTTEHTARTREQIGDPLDLNVSKMCLLCADADEARRLARRALAYYVTLDYYHRAWKTLGFTSDDFENGGSDRLIDAIVAWGDGDKIRTELDEHRDAGATHLVIVPLNPQGGREPAWDLLEQLA